MVVLKTPSTSVQRFLERLRVAKEEEAERKVKEYSFDFMAGVPLKITESTDRK